MNEILLISHIEPRLNNRVNQVPSEIPMNGFRQFAGFVFQGCEAFPQVVDVAVWEIGCGAFLRIMCHAIQPQFAENDTGQENCVAGIGHHLGEFLWTQWASHPRNDWAKLLIQVESIPCGRAFIVLLQTQGNAILGGQMKGPER